VIRGVLVEGRQTGVNPRVMAQRIRDSIGLVPSQEKALANYRLSLESGDWSRALGYQLSDGRSDRTIARFRRDGGALSTAQIDSMVERYRVNALSYRAETIARTEAMTAANSGASDAMEQAVSRGDVKAEELITTWHAGPRTKDSRDSHAALDGTSIKFGELFVLANGTRMRRPGDGPVAEVANCRCTISTTFRLD
nr:phage head morphogenesis protein [Acidobacteriota bacterium]